MGALGLSTWSGHPAPRSLAAETKATAGTAATRCAPLRRHIEDRARSCSLADACRGGLLPDIRIDANRQGAKAAASITRGVKPVGLDEWSELFGRHASTHCRKAASAPVDNPCLWPLVSNLLQPVLPTAAGGDARRGPKRCPHRATTPLREARPKSPGRPASSVIAFDGGLDGRMGLARTGQVTPYKGFGMRQASTGPPSSMRACAGGWKPAACSAASAGCQASAA